MQLTPEQRRAAIEIIHAIYEAIDAFGPVGIPSGHLYARLMDRMSLKTYQGIIDALVEAGKITNTNHVLRSTHK